MRTSPLHSPTAVASGWQFPVWRLLAGCGLLLATGLGPEARAQSLEESLAKSPHAALAAEARKSGDPVRGAAIFYARAMACSTCHSVGDRPESIGPDLTKLDAKLTDALLVEALLEPSKTIAPAYATVSIETADGRLLVGLPVEDTKEHLVLRDAAQPDKLVTIKKADIAQRDVAKQSIMPAGQMNRLADRGQFLDLVRYLIDLREGGAKRARELQPPPDPSAIKVPDEPLPWQPVVQRGEVAVDGGQKYPHAVAIGFAGGTVLFDANRLQTVGVWFDGFVKNTPQNYFGLYWQRDGKQLAENLHDAPHPLRFKLPGQTEWQSFEPAVSSDPNVGTKFGGYQIGKSMVRLHYHLGVGGQRIAVTEDVRAESRTQWQGYARAFAFAGLPAGTQVSLAPNLAGELQAYSAAGEKLAADIAATGDLSRAPLLGSRDKAGPLVVRGAGAAGAKWLPPEAAEKNWRLTTTAAAGAPLALRIDAWHYRGRGVEPTAAELATLAANPPQLNDTFEKSSRPAATLPVAQPHSKAAQPVAQRPPVEPKENIDEFRTVRARFLRFVVTRVTGNNEPGIDELEIYGPDPKVNLALSGKASASSCIKGYPIHQIPHLNDGKLGNNHSWISGEAGGGWAQIEFSAPVEMQKIVWARDRTGASQDRLASAYRIEVSDDGKAWQKVGDDSGRGPAIGVIKRDASPGYVMEAIPAPFSAWRPSDIAFGADGTLYAIAMTEGQIWRARTPPVGHPEQIEWQRYASGLYHPTGLAIVDGRIFVAQKPEITELIDGDGDGTVEQFRTVATGWGLSTGWHEYCFGLAVDPQKNLWFALNTGYFWTNPGYVNPGRWRGSVLRVSDLTLGQGAEKLEVMAKGCRVPNGVAQGPDGGIFFTDNQGDWIQVCKLAHVVPGRFYGHPEYKEDALPADKFPDGKSAIWFPYDRGRSVSGPMLDTTQGKFGPFAGQMFVGDVGYGMNPGILRVALEKVNGEYQGACFRFVDGQPLGCQRMRFGPDNQLYITSLTSGLTRMAYAGEPPLAIQSVRIRPKGAGFVVHLTKPLAENTALKPEQFGVQRYHYLYTGKYGSPKADEKKVPVEKAELSADRMAITLSFPVETYPLGMVYELNLGKLIGAGGETLLHNDAWYTVHNVPE